MQRYVAGIDHNCTQETVCFIGITNVETSKIIITPDAKIIAIYPIHN